MAKRRDRDRAERDRAGIGPEPGAAHRLVSLDDLNGYDIADGEPDIRGWDVLTVNGRELGEVEDLLVDPDRGEVVMLDVQLRDGGVHAEVPIRSVQIDRERKVVLLDSGDIDRAILSDERARESLTAHERELLQNDARNSVRSVRYTDADSATRTERLGTSSSEPDEVVVERRPVIEEVVIRRRVVDEE